MCLFASRSSVVPGQPMPHGMTQEDMGEEEMGRTASPGRVRSICRWVSISCAEKASSSEVPWLPSKATLGRLEAAPCNCWSIRRMPLGIMMAPGFTPVPEGLAPAAAAAAAGCIPLRSIMAGCMPCRVAGKLRGCQAQLGQAGEPGRSMS